MKNNSVRSFRIDDDLYERLQLHALKHGATAASVLTVALENHLSGESAPPSAARYRLVRTSEACFSASVFADREDFRRASAVATINGTTISRVIEDGFVKYLDAPAISTSQTFPAPGMNADTMSYSIPRALYDEVKREARRRGQTAAAVVRGIVADYLDGDLL